ncbi:hypothetical protein [Salipiger bermudensis]|uniref:hypothetical protein n=1 Tax=Salipiger bermudensis TaxID=344736 RepID=UPI001CD1C021|nr:hypothetical protein [Salipiger bermudensis]MCA1288603.1 hypothetical protein [Salipiger bermudensis]
MHDRAAAKDRFRSFIDSFDVSSDILPLLHTTEAYSFSEICESASIEPAYCKHFRKRIVYLFYGRPAYRVEDAAFATLEFNWPIVFIFDPEKIDDISAVYPFDTGAFFFNLYHRFFSKKSRIEDFSLPGSVEYAKKIVGIFYENENSYFYGGSTKNLDIPNRQFEAQGIQEMSRMPALFDHELGERGKRDERSTSVELHSDSKIDIRQSTIGIILPQPYMEDGEIRRALERWDIENILTYEVIRFHDQSAWAGQIYQRILDFYKKEGYL